MVSRLITTGGGFLGEELWVSQVIAFATPCQRHTYQCTNLMVAIEYTSTVLMLSELASVGRASLTQAAGPWAWGAACCCAAVLSWGWSTPPTLTRAVPTWAACDWACACRSKTAGAQCKPPAGASWQGAFNNKLA